MTWMDKKIDNTANHVEEHLSESKKKFASNSKDYSPNQEENSKKALETFKNSIGSQMYDVNTKLQHSATISSSAETTAKKVSREVYQL